MIHNAPISADTDLVSKKYVDDTFAQIPSERTAGEFAELDSDGQLVSSGYTSSSFEPALGNPDASGKVLASTDAGVRSWAPVANIDDEAGDGDTAKAWSADKLVDHTIATARTALTSSDNGKLVAVESTGNGDSNTILLLHCDGEDQSTTITDSGGGDNCPHTVTANGGAQIDTAQSKFGGASLYFDGTDDYLSVPDSADWQLGGGTGNFTVDLWFRFADATAVSNGAMFLEQYEDNNHRWYVHFTGTQIYAYYVNGGSFGYLVGATAITVTHAQWYHLAFVRNGDNFSIYLDGVEVNTDEVSSFSMPDYTGSLYVGCDFYDSTPGVLFSGHLDEIRISNVARWTTAFTPPTVSYDYPIYNPSTALVANVPSTAEKSALADGVAGTKAEGDVVIRSAANAVAADTVSEVTGANGVTIDGLKIKDAGFALGSDADGDIYYRASSALARLAKGTANQLLRMNSGASAPEWATVSSGASRWTQITAFNDQAASTSTVTMTSDLTGSIPVGSPIKFKLSGSYYYAQVTALTSELMTIRGAPLTTGDGDLTEVWYGTPEMVRDILVSVPGAFEDATNTTLLASDLYTYYRWSGVAAYCVGFEFKEETADSGATQPNVNVLWGGNRISTANTNAGPLLTASIQSTVVDINTTNYAVAFNEQLEIETTKGTNGNAMDLTIKIVMVLA